MKPHYVSSWELWYQLGKHYGFDPYENVNFSLSRGGGNSTDFEYVGDIPEKECLHKNTVAINEEGHAGIFCSDCGKQIEKEC